MPRQPVTHRGLSAEVVYMCARQSSAPRLRRGERRASGGGAKGAKGRLLNGGRLINLVE